MRILVADDMEPTRVLLHDLLKHWGHEPIMAVDGQGAWDILESEDPPRLAILDWVMPAPDGPAICRRLYARRIEQGRFVYVILLTAKNQTTDLVEALSAGAHDFVSKPFDPAELRSRIHVGAQIIEYESMIEDKDREIRRYAEHMEELAQERAGQTIHAGRLATLGAMGAAILHEIRNPLFAITGNLTFQDDAVERLAKAIGPNPDSELAAIGRDLRDAQLQIGAAADRIGKTISNLGAFARKDTPERGTCSPNSMVANALALCSVVTRPFVVREQLADALPTPAARPQEIEQVLFNLITNACHALEGRADGTIVVSARERDGVIEFAVEDNGPGISPGVLDRIFDAFFTTKVPGMSLGLGLSISSTIAASHGGRISCENPADGKGARFVFWIPLTARADQG